MSRHTDLVADTGADSSAAGATMVDTDQVSTENTPDSTPDTTEQAPAVEAPEAEAPNAEPDPEPAAPASRNRPGLDSKGRIKRTRAGTLWFAAVSVAVVMVALVIFVVQNSQNVEVSFLGFGGQFSLATTILIAAAGGALVVGIPAAVRIAQLRHALRKAAKDS